MVSRSTRNLSKGGGTGFFVAQHVNIVLRTRHVGGTTKRTTLLLKLVPISQASFVPDFVPLYCSWTDVSGLQRSEKLLLLRLATADGFSWRARYKCSKPAASNLHARTYATLLAP